MKCPRCQHENRPGAKFCEECAGPLARVCVNCGAQLSATAKFCSECAHPAGPAAPPAPQRFGSPETYTPKHLAERIINSKAALEGERKQVTVLFADLKGSMELLADRDPEEARKILDPVLELMMEAVHRYEGTVNQVMGDGIMALFGAPLAHEDHAVRACYAALRMQESVTRHAGDVRRTDGTSVRIRVGLNSGEVVVRAIGSDLRMDYSAIGQTTHLAARMEQLADPGTIRLTRETLHLAEGFVQVQALGPTAVKGLAVPVEVYELTGASSARSRLQASEVRGLTTFVGRDAEMAALSTAIEQMRMRHGRVVAIVGEPGLGKSRLIREFTRSQGGDDCIVLEAASMSSDGAASYRPLIELLKAYLEIGDRDTQLEIRENLTQKILALDRALEPALPALLTLLGMPVEDPPWRALDPLERRERTLDALKRVLLRVAEARPTVVVFEDLHWVDSETQALLDALVDSIADARLLLLVTFRPEYQHGWRSKACYTKIQLDALPRETVGELLDALLGHDASVDPLKDLLAARTGRNPLFLEESVRALVEAGALLGERGSYRLTRSIDGIQVPPTVQAILASRIDRLPNEEKRLLEMASVIGTDFSFALLQVVADSNEEALREGLAHLRAAEFLYETSLFPDLEYTFEHALTQEVAYGGLLLERRRELHARVVEALETLYPEQSGEHVERLAHHAHRGALQEKAVRYLRQAGLKAAAHSALAAARVWFEQALTVLETLPETPFTRQQAVDLRLDLRAALMALSEIRQALARLREAESLSERLNDERRHGQVCAFLTNAHASLGETAKALVTGERALQIADRLGDSMLRILAASFLGQAYYYRGEYTAGVALATDTLAAMPPESLSDYSPQAIPPLAFLEHWLIRSLAELGKFTEGGRHTFELLRLAEIGQRAFTFGMAYASAGTLYISQGDWEKAHSLVEAVVNVARARQLVRVLPGTVSASAWVLAQIGESGEVLARVREGERLLESNAARGDATEAGLNYHALGRACLLLGRLDEATSLAQRAVESSSSQPGFLAHAHHLLGDIAMRSERFDDRYCEARYRQALDLAEPRGMRPLVAHCHLGLGKLYRRTGQHEQAHEHLTTANSMYREMGMTYWLEKAEAEMRDLG